MMSCGKTQSSVYFWSSLYFESPREVPGEGGQVPSSAGAYELRGAYRAPKCNRPENRGPKVRAWARDGNLGAQRHHFSYKDQAIVWRIQRLILSGSYYQAVSDIPAKDSSFVPAPTSWVLATSVLTVVTQPSCFIKEPH